MIKIIKAEIKHAELIAKIGEQTFWESHGISAPKADIIDFVSKKYTKEALINELKKELKSTPDRGSFKGFKVGKFEYNDMEISRVNREAGEILIDTTNGLKKTLGRQNEALRRSYLSVIQCLLTGG